jgi:hypothetical protein
VNSRFAVLREVTGKGLIWLAVFAAKWPSSGQNRRNSRFDGKNREFSPSGGWRDEPWRRPDNGADLRGRGRIVPLIANRSVVGVQHFATIGLTPDQAAGTSYLYRFAAIGLDPLL